MPQPETDQQGSSNVVWHHATVTRKRRCQLNGHCSAILWFTGLSGSGKSTLAHAVEERLYKLGYHTFVLDGDNVRHGLNADLGFSIEDRTENIRRLGEVAKLFLDAGVIIMTAFISPLRQDRHRVRGMVGEDDFLEVYCDCPIEVCEQRDVKGLYKRARAGEIPDFTGISSPYESPGDAEVRVLTAQQSLDESVEQVLDAMRERDIIPSD